MKNNKLKIGCLCFVYEDDMDIPDILGFSYIGKVGKIIKFSGRDCVILKFNDGKSCFYKSEVIKINK